jgi:putative glutamine amidotransferase
VPERPVIGIATQGLEAIPGERPPCWIMGQRYVRVLASVGAVPWLIPLLPEDSDTLRAVYDRLDGLFLTGGVDVDPLHYGEERHALCGKTDRDRDQTEIQLIRWALADCKPILGVCRGIQVINVAAGGTLFQDVAFQNPRAIKHDYFPSPGGFERNLLVHAVLVAADSQLGRIMGVEQVQVNSMHHQGIKDLAPGLTPSAFAPDGLIEGVEIADGQFLIGVQWHPEELAEESAVMRQLFTAFIEACKSPLPSGEKDWG